ncbi:MAG: tyrosine-type recombinase/integrase [Oribacterium sp.]|nr:tyrosine-type recombinase/integrase [Oribacterium sp.]
MGALLRIVPKLDTERLYRQLSVSKGVTGKAREFVAQYLLDSGVDSLNAINLTALMDYRKYVRSLLMKKEQKEYYENLLEQVCFAFLISTNIELSKIAETILKSRAIRNKTIGFMLLCGIQSTNDIDYELRSEYQKYLTETLSAKVSEYVKAMDKLKIASINHQNQENPLRTPVLKYENKKIFLLYHPSYQLAMTFYYVQDKEELMFDFSVATSAVMKRQIFKMLNHVLKTKENCHDRRERFIIPLKLFYQYCIKHGVDDIELILEKQIQGFHKSIDGKVGTKTETYMQLVDNIRKFLFLEAKTTNWNANAWYLERFSFEDGRMNPAREIRRFTFGQIENKKNRDLLKAYMKYQLGVSQKSSIQTIRGRYYDILSFLLYLDEKKTSAVAVTAEDMEKYINYLDEKDIQPEGFNRALISVARFYGYIITTKEISKAPLYFDYYFKNTFARHNDRAVSEESQKEILHNLKNFPVHLRLMYLNLWCIGLRITEVCVIKGGAYYWDGKDAWIKIYQNKMKNEKYVPIPALLYQAMMKYITEKDIGSDEYVFKNRRGGAYDAGTFCKQFKHCLEKAGINDYDFKSHDFRHTVGTYLYAHGASIEAIRDYLGHKVSDMTKQYLDYMPDIIDSANEEYFASRSNKLADTAKTHRKGGK